MRVILITIEYNYFSHAYLSIASYNNYLPRFSLFLHPYYIYIYIYIYIHIAIMSERKEPTLY